MSPSLKNPDIFYEQAQEENPQETAYYRLPWKVAVNVTVVVTRW